jgi:hypothetical protein
MLYIGSGTNQGLGLPRSGLDGTLEGQGDAVICPDLAISLEFRP